MPELDADFEISTNNLEAEYEITQSEHFDCSFEIYASGTTWGSITGNIEEQTDLQDILSDLQSNIDDIADDLSIETDNRQTADADLQDNIDTVDGKIDTHIADKTNPHEVTKAQIGLGNVDNTSDLNKPISTATQTALNGKQNTINDLATIRTNASNGQSAYNTIQNYGDIVTYDASYFATKNQGEKADTALQPNDNITELNNNAGYITSASLPTVNNNKITIQKNSTDAGSFTLNQSSDKTINISVPTQASDINAVPTSRKINNKPLSSDITLTASDVNALSSSTTINDLTTSAQQDALNSGATSTNIGQIATNTQNITNEVTNRQNADNNLQSQIDAIVASSDVFDIVGTYADLQAYDISTVPVNDIIKVLVDSTHSNAATYYRCVETGGVKSWSYIGSEGAYYTKSESDSLFVDKTTTVNGKALSSSITLTASDVGALPSSTVIGNGTLTIQNNSVDVDTFSANATSNKTINIVTPTKTSDLTNDSGFIDSSALSGLATQTDLTNGLATKQDTISDLSTIRSNATNGQSAYTTIGGYGDIVTHNTSEFATSAQGDLADTSIQPNDNITLLNNNAGFISGIDSTDVITALGYTPYNSTNPNNFTSNVGTVTSVNNTQPDADGNVTIQTGGATDVQINGTSITSQGVANILTETAYNSSTNKIATMSDVPSITHLANKNLDNLSATGESHFLKNIAGGTNSLSILAYGNVNGNNATSIGVNSRALGNGSISLGTDASNYAQNSIAIGYQANVDNLCDSAIQLGYGTNSTAKSFSVGFYDYSTPTNYQLLDGTTGLIPDARLSTNIARTSDIPSTSTFEQVANKVTSISSSSTDTQYPSAKSVIELLKTIYPVGSVYLSTNSTCPLSSLFGTWSLVSSGRALWTGDGSNGGTTIAAGLPDHAHTYLYRESTHKQSGSSTSCWVGSKNTLTDNASNSNSIYGNSNTVQPPAYVVNAFRRTA